MQAAGITEETVNGLTDLFSAFKWLQTLKLDSKGITDVDGAKCRLLQYLQETKGNGKSRGHNASSLVQGVLDNDKKQREELVGIYRHVEMYLSRLPPARWRELEESNPGYSERMLRNIRNLEKSDCAILVAGEVSSGKSSLLNLIFGTSILPTSLLSCTSVICELKYGREPYALAHSWDDKKPPERIELTEKDASEVLAPYVHQKGDRFNKFPFKRIQVFWPFPALKGGIVMVDSPGVGESSEMTKLVKEYLPDAFAFIYVINSSNAGGLQPDRLQDLLAELTRNEDGGQMFDPRSAIFVCNKWDLVPAEEAEQVKEDTLEKLRKCWRGIEERQLIFMSTTKALKSLQESDYLTKDYAKLLDAIETLFPISLRCKLESHYRWLVQLLRRSAFYLQAHIANETRTEEERKELTERLHNQLDKLETESRRVQEELRKDLHERTGRACAELTTYLDDSGTRERLAEWEANECPQGKDWESIHEILISKVKKKIRREVNDWDNRNGVFSDIQAELIERFQQEFALMEDQLGVIEGGMIGSNKTRPTDNYEAIRKLKLEASVPMLTTNQKIALGIAAPLLIPLGVVVGLFALPVAGIRALKNKLEEMKLLREYQEDKTKVMGVVTEDVLASFIDNNNLTKLIREQLDSLSTNAEVMMKAIPKLIEADRTLLNKLQEQRAASEMALVEELLPMFHKCQSLQAMVDLYYVEQVRTYDVNLSDIVYINPVPLSTGHFGDVYQATLQEANGKRNDICVKYRKDHLSAKNISEVLIEEEQLRKMKQDNILKCTGTSSKSENQKYTTHIILVLEHCTETLVSKITGPDARIPASYSTNPVWFRKSSKMLFGYGLQIANGLCYLHERALVHRDLKPEVILLTNEDVIKLSDVGLSKPEGCISGSMYEFSNYSAPEVIEGREFNCAADIFSFVMILWELWYGRRVHEDILASHSGTCESAIRAGARPDITKSLEPDEELVDLFTRGWNANAQNRPTSLECICFFQGKIATSNTTSYESFDTISLS